ncbi:MAG: helix-turn-helix transcriptional regulator [Phycisphaerae bacterium]|nr:helix-turn-helix transcriptional regulator [Phycisphaerae bacterium]
MVDSHETIGHLFRQRRRQKKWTQADVAQQIGSKQSQISSFENGNEHALAREKVTALAKLLHISEERLLARPINDKPACGFCTNRHCPTSFPYVRGEVVVFRPTFLKSNRPYCRWCGEPMRYDCSECQAPIEEGLNCTACGAEYLDHVHVDNLDAGNDPETWARQQRKDNAALTTTRRPSEPGQNQPKQPESKEAANHT